MNWFADLLEESRSDLGRSASPERREKFSRLQKLYQSYRKRTQYWANRHAAGQCLHYQRSTGHAGPIHPECKPYAALIERDKEDVKAGKETPSSALEADLDYSAWMAGETARKPFDALTNSRKQDFFAQFGLNEWAAPDMGDALTIVHGGIKAREEGQQGPWQRRQNRALDGTDPGSEPANFHYAAVIMTSGSDYVTFENVTGGEPDGWYFQLYGQRHEEDQSFHAQWKEIAGNRPTTMVLRPVDLGSD